MNKFLTRRTTYIVVSTYSKIFQSVLKKIITIDYNMDMVDVMVADYKTRFQRVNAELSSVQKKCRRQSLISL